METYHFVTKWFFRAPIESVWQELVEAETWPAWWKNWKKAAPHGKGGAVQVGATADHEVRGFLPFTLRFSTQITALQAPRLLEAKSTGDLVGVGKFELEARDSGTYVTYTWEVGTSRAIMSFLAKLPFARLLMEINHDSLMENGYRGLKLRLEGPAARFPQPVYHW